MSSTLANPELIKTVVLLATSITIVPLFKRIGLGSVLGYLVAGCLIGPSGAGLFQDPNAVVHMAELGVVMFLFIIGLEMHPERLWSMRKAIFGRGFLQVALCGTLLTFAGIFILGLPKEVAFIAGMGFTLSSTAIVMQVLEEKGISTTPKGQRIVSTLIFEDLAIVPLLASIAFLAPEQAGAEQGTNWTAIGAGLVGVLILVASGKWLMNPLFKMISKAHIREMMTAAALLVVLGSALLMELSGLSMAMGAFVAGVMLSESSFRHQLEADIEPFRGLLLGLFFMGVGMSLDLSLVLNNWLWLLGVILLYVVGKGLSIYVVALVTKLTNREAIMRTSIMSHGGEFAFVLFSAAATAGVFTADNQATFTAAVIVSMLLSPLVVIVIQRLVNLKAKKSTGEAQPNLEGIEFAENLESSVLVIGFGRFSQIVCQVLLARGINVSVIDSDVENIRMATRFGFKVYYGDGARIDVLRASGIAQADCVIVGLAEPDRTLQILELIKHEYPLVPVFARSYDRLNTVNLIKRHVDYQVRETFESALLLSKVTLERLGATETEAQDVINLVRHLDQERLNEEVLHGFSDEIAKKYWRVEPFVKPAHEATALNEETADILEEVGESIEVVEVELDDQREMEKIKLATDEKKDDELS
ncbi:monovalent cation:proton antiporter-2 (CPA2) family protein [Glaesserella parasuis]|uniref:monovalent cation:proton antiporter-2 (CPA2) family protein n=1 Tax=Glaesserella parasuis TaxID=738 RepID=UPI00094F74A3|nr:monovalent cation:proton antiporter-2 (CPA2) family protein [Glaesserella parasuis]MDG6345981.1 monovalent cation:proton antiporter-2 (CPA2) family protein [Glaesserella parasuis]MDG6771609.1 monovalent cation:proton antiporter-2 (CPA2) family protein [Glaesserella parasuis]MDO9795801.1 monovalent cation:proton antiporter-2 (CPA2) family protein [Glaesserella parasuis]MDO9872947.1 monovalent cation:proton antiporter-2 (CPA2) family protein [Glaesserella parasuis]MDP0340634.1 monovalent cati